MLNRAIEIHDSVLASVSFAQGEAQLHFSSVYIHQSEGAPLRDAGSGWVQKAVLRIRDAKMTTKVPWLSTRRRHGSSLKSSAVPVLNDQSPRPGRSL